MAAGARWLQRLEAGPGPRDAQRLLARLLRQLERRLPLCASLALAAAEPPARGWVVAHVGPCARSALSALGLRAGRALADDARLAWTRATDAPRVYAGAAAAAPSIVGMLRADGCGAVIVVPLRAFGHHAGLLALAGRPGPGFTAAELALVTRLARHLPRAWRQACGQHRLQQAFEALGHLGAATARAERLAQVARASREAAHAINNKLGPATLYLDSVLQQPLDARLQQRLQIVLRAVDDAAAEVRGLRGDAGHDSQDGHEAGGIEALLRDACRRLPPDIDCRWLVTPALPQAEVDTGVLRELLERLLDDLCAAMPGGGHLSVRIEPDRGGVRIELADDRRGTPPLARGRRPGAPAHDAARRLGGRLVGRWRPGRGATSVLWLPLNRPPQGGARPAGPDRAQARRTPRDSA